MIAGLGPGLITRVALRILREEGPVALARRLRRRIAILLEQRRRSYSDWIAAFDTLGEVDLVNLRAAAAALPHRPLISVIMPVHETPRRLLEEAIASVSAQAYDNWELCICDDASTASHVAAVLAAASAADPRIKVTRRVENGRIARASNDALALATGDFVAMLDHDDVLRPHALFCMAEAIGRHPDAAILYSDEDKIDDAGRRFDPYFKPDFSPELFLGQNYLNHLTLFRRAEVVAAGGWRPERDGSQDYDLALRILARVGAARVIHVPRILYHWRATAGSTAVATGEKSYAFTAGLRALEDHVAAALPGARVEPVGGAPYYRVVHPVPEPLPLVTILIPTRDGGAVLDRCLTSLVARTDYQAFEVVVIDNGSAARETLALLESWPRRDGRIRVLRDDRPFNFAALNNAAAAKARGDLLCLLNDDVEILEPGWLREMVSLAVRPEIGCVGAKLLYPDGSLQHGGVVLGIGGVAGHAFKHTPAGEPGHFWHLGLRRTVSAVTAACLVVRASVYAEVGGLDAEHLAVAFNDVDFCLKVREAGYRNVWTPFACLKHHESLSRGAETTPEKRARFERETTTMMARWGEKLLNDPFYSPNLTLAREDQTLGFPPRLHPLA
ncbi:glycosyltransferase [Phreatobacter sp.]|uniref:glycosyltransferase family 2 protein n=1 Tax=Phreatobacter sp. TaxID=1966341 RepID=UPI0022C2368B|nr:glycosyltransferase [Phreatobacter sp.]MCZ8314953.1 glycosyltransferase [Phreatobacter sp.]